MRLVDKRAPFTARRDLRYRLRDDFLRFWFRFVFPFQENLRSGLRPVDHYEAEVAPALPQHVAPVFEDLCRRWVRRNLGSRASQVGPWWGRSLDRLRATGERGSEEIDVVGLHRGRVSIVGECKWTAKPISVLLLREIEKFKLPALKQSGAKVRADGPLIVLFSRSGFTDGLKTAAQESKRLRLVEIAELVPAAPRA